MDEEPVIPWAPVDPLGGVLGDLRMRGTFYSRTDGTAPWGVEMPALGACMTFHVITEGSCLLEVDGEVHVLVDLHAGDAEATIWTNDLTHDYVHENSAYST